MRKWVTRRDYTGLIKTAEILGKTSICNNVLWDAVLKIRAHVKDADSALKEGTLQMLSDLLQPPAFFSHDTTECMAVLYQEDSR